MPEAFTRNELIFFKIVGWTIAILVPWILYRWNSKELKESEKSQGKRIDNLLKKLQEEVIARKNLEKKVAEDKAEEWKSLYYQAKESSEKYYKRLEEMRKENDRLRKEFEEEVDDLRNQLLTKGIPREKHDISDERKRQEAIFEIELHWKFNQNKGKKINGRTMAEILGENWESIFDNKEGEDIIKEKNWLIRKINYEINQQGNDA